MTKLTIGIRHHITYESIKDLLDSASRGSDYWCGNSLMYEKETERALASNNIGVLVEDIEAGKSTSLNLQKIKKGLTIMAKKYPSHFADFIKEDYDNETGDVFLQCCLFGKVIYG